MAWRLMFGGAILLGVTLSATALAGSFWQVMLLMFISGAGSSAFQLLNNSLIMQYADQSYYGRVMSLTMMAWGLNGLVGFPIGLAADAFGERQTLFVLGAGVVLVTAAAVSIHVSLNRKSESQPLAIPTLAGGD